MPFVVGYGTLMLRPSLGDTIGPEAALRTELIPVRVEGFRRLYNLGPDHYQPSSRLSAEGNERAAANVRSEPEAWFNGLAFAVDQAMLEALDRRERGYRRVGAALEQFETGESLGDGFLYLFPPRDPQVIDDPALLLPRWLDLHYARFGAYAASEAFGQAFDRSSFLADGATPVLQPFTHLLKELEQAPSR
jgi:hypothetical protein